ncbi:MAG: nuclear transport factor 2 family protein [Pseudonocardiaceae bacterium]
MSTVLAIHNSATHGVCGPDSGELAVLPGRSPLSGDYKGHDEVVGFFAETMRLSAGTFTIRIDDVLAAGDRVVVLCTVAAERNGESWSSFEVHVWRVVNQRAIEFWEYQGDQQTEDEFWSA